MTACGWWGYRRPPHDIMAPNQMSKWQRALQYHVFLSIICREISNPHGNACPQVKHQPLRAMCYALLLGTKLALNTYYNKLLMM